MTIDADLARLIEGSPKVNQDEQAFPLLTVDEHGFPHVALLSRSEIATAAERTEILVALRSRHTLANIARDRKATLIAVGGTVAHYAKLAAQRSHDDGDGLVAWAFEVVEHKADSIDIPLRPMGFRTSDHVAQVERWDASAQALQTLAQS